MKLLNMTKHPILFGCFLGTIVDNETSLTEFLKIEGKKAILTGTIVPENIPELDVLVLNPVINDKQIICSLVEHNTCLEISPTLYRIYCTVFDLLEERNIRKIDTCNLIDLSSSVIRSLYISDNVKISLDTNITGIDYNEAGLKILTNSVLPVNPHILCTLSRNLLNESTKWILK